MEDLLQIVESILGVPHVAISDRFAEDLEAESIDVVNIVAAVEERYEITFDQADLAEVHTVADLGQLVRAALE